MSAQTRRRLVILVALVVAALLAFPLRQTLYDALILPVSFFAWNLNLFYRSLPQGIWWWIIVLVVLFMLAFSLLPQPNLRRRVEIRSHRRVGQVEGLAATIQKSERGIYFKWTIANRLGRLAHQILLQRESGRPRSMFAPLVGTDWEPSQPLRTYLEIGLHGSFADFPHVRRPFRRPEPTPLDHDIREAVEFLESQVANQSPQRREDAEIS